jgi:hypothetical protein
MADDVRQHFHIQLKNTQSLDVKGRKNHDKHKTWKSRLFVLGQQLKTELLHEDFVGDFLQLIMYLHYFRYFYILFWSRKNGRRCKKTFSYSTQKQTSDRQKVVIENKGTKLKKLGGGKTTTNTKHEKADYLF